MENSLIVSYFGVRSNAVTWFVGKRNKGKGKKEGQVQSVNLFICWIFLATESPWMNTLFALPFEMAIVIQCCSLIVKNYTYFDSFMINYISACWQLELQILFISFLPYTNFLIHSETKRRESIIGGARMVSLCIWLAPLMLPILFEYRLYTMSPPLVILCNMSYC